MIDRARTRLARQPTVGKLTVPYMVDAARKPIDFKIVDDEHIKRCATHRRCGICGGRIRERTLAFIGPGDDVTEHRACFSDPWMHETCARAAMQQCPFLAGRRGWRDDDHSSLTDRYEHAMALFLAPDGSAHRGPFKEWHFAASGELRRVELERGEAD